MPLFVWSPDRVLYLLAEHLTASGLGPVVAMVPEACPDGLMGATKDAMRALKVLKEEDGQVCLTCLLEAEAGEGKGGGRGVFMGVPSFLHTIHVALCPLRWAFAMTSALSSSSRPADWQ